MSWANNHISRLKNGQTVRFRPRGNSMSGKIEDGQLVTVAPAKVRPKRGDIVLCTVGGRQYLHLVKAVMKDRCLIGNNRGKMNGWTPWDHVYGIVIRIGDG